MTVLALVREMASVIVKKVIWQQKLFVKKSKRATSNSSVLFGNILMYCQNVKKEKCRTPKSDGS